eukprot:m.371289 g.371289  ORF g.371289 m.371289 type:complete len:335 (+) comp20864_c0_seq44:1095-2099(+)
MHATKNLNTSERSHPRKRICIRGDYCLTPKNGEPIIEQQLQRFSDTLNNSIGGSGPGTTGSENGLEDTFDSFSLSAVAEERRETRNSLQYSSASVTAYPPSESFLGKHYVNSLVDVPELPSPMHYRSITTEAHATSMSLLLNNAPTSGFPSMTSGFLPPRPVPYASTRYIISGRRGLCLASDGTPAEIMERDGPDRTPIVRPVPRPPFRSVPERASGVDEASHDDYDRFTCASTDSYFADYEYSSDDSSGDGSGWDDAAVGGRDGCASDSCALESERAYADQLAVTLFPDLKDELPQTRRLRSIMNVAERWGIPHADAAELMRNVELANPNTVW